MKNYIWKTVFTILIGTLLTACTTKSEITVPSTNNISPGSLTISEVKTTSTRLLYKDDQNIIVGQFSARTNESEDVELTGITTEMYTNVNINRLSHPAIENLKITDQDGNIFTHSGVNTENYPFTTQFNGKTIIPKSTSKLFTITLTVPDESPVDDITTSIKGASQISAIGASSRKKIIVSGKIYNDTFFKTKDGKGAILLRSDKLFEPNYPRISKKVVLSKISVYVSSEEDVVLNKIELRISNYVPGQYKNISLIKEDGSKYGSTIISPIVKDINQPNVVFTDSQLLKANSTTNYNLVADTNIPSSKSSNYGTQLQREIVVNRLSPENSSHWVLATGVNSTKEVSSYGGVDTHLNFAD